MVLFTDPFYALLGGFMLGIWCATLFLACNFKIERKEGNY